MPASRPGWIAAVGGGLLTTAAFPPFGFWPGGLLGPLALLWALPVVGAGRALWLGWLFGFAHFVTGIWWVVISTHVYGGAPLWLALPMMLLLAAYLALFPALAAGLYLRLRPRAAAPALLLVWPACWLLGEFGRNWVLDGFPWFSLGYLATDIPGALKLAALLGVHGLSALLALAAGAGLLLLRRRWFAAGGALGGLLLALLLAPPPSDWTQSAGPALDVVAVQGNVPQEQKWRSENLEPTLELYRRLTEQAWPADLVVWPEVAIPTSQARVAGYFKAMDASAAAQGGTLFAGVITRHQGKSYNTVYALGRDQGRYVKQHLVPFGEYIPAPDWARPLFALLDLPFPDISTDLEGLPRLAVGPHEAALSICFEDVFPEEIRVNARASALLVNVTNDAWFAGSAAPAQHLQIARLRAAESGREMVRVANTGISAFIDSDGAIRSQLPWGERGLLRAAVTPRQGDTPYLAWGQWPLYGWLLAAGLACALLRWRAFRRVDPNISR